MVDVASHGDGGADTRLDRPHDLDDSLITDVQRGASETGSASSQVLSAAQMLSGDSNRLKTEVSKFLDSVRAA